jgi:hypothetical protein
VLYDQKLESTVAAAHEVDPVAVERIRRRVRAARVAPARFCRRLSLATAIDRVSLLALELEDHESARVLLRRCSILTDQDRLAARQRDHVFGIGKRADGSRIALRFALGDGPGRKRLSTGE